MPSNITVMHVSVTSRYLPDTTVSDLLDNLMVEDWVWSDVYAEYYKVCQPTECRYSAKKKWANFYCHDGDWLDWWTSNRNETHSN
jgi:hypothetical protein